MWNVNEGVDGETRTLGLNTIKKLVESAVIIAGFFHARASGKIIFLYIELETVRIKQTAKTKRKEKRKTYDPDGSFSTLTSIE